MKYDPVLDKDVGIVCAGREFFQIQNSGALFVLASEVCSIENLDKALSASSSCNIYCDCGIVSAISSRTFVQKVCHELCIKMPINLIVECGTFSSAESILFIAHGAFDEICFVIFDEDPMSMQRKAFSVVSDVNGIGHKLTKHFGYKTRILVKGFFSEINKEAKQCSKRISSLIGDPRLCEIELVRILDKKEEQDEDGVPV